MFNYKINVALSFVDKVIQKGFNFCSFDFSGTGLSQGKYVSLGFFQKYDILAVLQYIYQKFHITKFILWGRSMGAAAAIKFMSMITPSSLNISKAQKYEIQSIILDSPFHSLSQLTVQIAKQKIKIPEIFIKAILIMIQSSIQSKAGFKLSQMQLLQDVKSIKCPVLLLTSRDDKLVLSSHSEKIYQTITHKDREIIFIKGEHNQNRQPDTILDILQFARNTLNKKKSKINSKQSQNLQKSSKVFYNYKYSNNLVVSSAIGTKSYSKLQNNSDVVRYDTCGDEDLRVQKQGQKQFYKEAQKQKQKQKQKTEYSSIIQPSYQRNTIQKQHFSQSIDSINYTMKNNIFKKSLNLCSAKIDKDKFKQKNKTKNSQIKNQSRDFTTEVKNIVFRPNNQQRTPLQRKIILTQNKSKTDIKQQITFQYQSEKKVPTYDNTNKISLQINRSPTKDPPRIALFKDNFSTPISKQSARLNNQDDIRQNLPHTQKVQIKNNQKKKLYVQVISSQSHDKISPNIEVNHFNIINQKLKRKKKKQSADNDSLKLPEPKDNRAVSISIERKSQIPIKSPPQFIKLKLFHQQQQIRSKNI